MDKLKSLFEQAKQKLEENKETVIRVTGVLVGILVGAGVASYIANQQDLLDEEVTMSLVDDEDIED